MYTKVLRRREQGVKRVRITPERIKIAKEFLLANSVVPSGAEGETKVFFGSRQKIYRDYKG
jgi:hypothetical protein